MLISEKQIMTLIQIISVCIKKGKLLTTQRYAAAKLLDDIHNQQSEELKVIE